MHKPTVSALVYKKIYPSPRPQQDPNSWAQHVSRHLVPEVRLETTNFYGALDCVEAQYPGLDYSHPPHRARLWRFTNHRRLFRVMDELGLTKSEIYSLCQWEGTKSAKDKYERDTGRPIRDTTADGVEEDERREPVRITHYEEDDLDDSYGLLLNRRLRDAADRHARGEPVIFDEQWEQWMKEALERRELSEDVIVQALRDNRPFPTTPSTVIESFDPIRETIQAEHEALEHEGDDEESYDEEQAEHQEGETGQSRECPEPAREAQTDEPVQSRQIEMLVRVTASSSTQTAQSVDRQQHALVNITHFEGGVTAPMVSPTMASARAAEAR